MIPLLAVGLLSAGCGAVDENPLNVNGDRAEPTAPVGGESQSGSTLGKGSASAAALGDMWGDDPLGIAKDGAKLCGVQPQNSFQQYTLLLHNPTLETFTFSGVELGSPQGLRIVSTEVTPANKEGHGDHGAAPAGAGHSGHDAAAPTPTETEPESSTFLVDPVPAEGFIFEPDAHIDVVVEVALDESVETGVADNIVVDFSSPTRDYSVEHPLDITVERTACS